MLIPKIDGIVVFNPLLLKSVAPAPSASENWSPGNSKCSTAKADFVDNLDLNWRFNASTEFGTECKTTNTSSGIKKAQYKEKTIPIIPYQLVGNNECYFSSW